MERVLPLPSSSRKMISGCSAVLNNPPASFPASEKNNDIQASNLVGLAISDVSVHYIGMTYMRATLFNRELKKGSAALLILSMIEHRPRHGYEIGKLIEERSGGTLQFNVASFYPLLYRLEQRGLIQGRWVEKAGQRR